jgi:excinuclease ABC subunit C
VLAERHGFYLENRAERDEAEVTEEFAGQYYSAAPAVPGLVVVGPAMKGRTELLAEALARRRGSPVEVRVAERGDKRRLRELADRNARLALGQEQLRRERRRRQRTEALSELAAALDLAELPVRIEGFDVSNLGPEHTVASMVAFEGGTPKKADYRKFRIREEDRPGADPAAPGRGAEEAAGPDDYAAVEQVISRRIARHLEGADLSPHDERRDESFASLPNLIVIDGGKGQLSAGMRAARPLLERARQSGREVAVIGLAKRLEEVYVPGRRAPVAIEPGSEALRLLQRVRDEAHRFALDFHRERRGKAMRASVLDELRGVGPARKRALLDHFGAPDRVLAASREELEATPGVPGKVARDIHAQLHRTVG